MAEARIILALSLRTLPLAVVVMLGACASGPDYRAPSPALPTAFVHAETSPLAAPDDNSLRDFWKRFGDGDLDRLIDAALRSNIDLRIALARLREARATLLGTEADALPSIGLDASATRSLAPEWQQPGRSRSERTGSVYAASGLMNWELDLFGRNRRATESAAAQVTAQQMGVGAARVVVVAAVASTYLSLRGLQQRLSVAEESLANQRESLRLTEARLGAGRGTEFDVARARSLVAGTAASLPALQAQIDRNLQRLAVLTGLPAATLIPRLSSRQAPPSLPATDLGALPVGTPEALLRRRPDIQVAERQLAAATADIGVAVADRFPRLSLSGLLGLNGHRLGDLGTSGSGVYSLGAALSWTAFDFGRTRSRIEGAEARAERSLLLYEQTVLTALEETENALSGYTRSAQQAAQLVTAARSAQDAAEIARRRYAAGSTDLLAVLDAERQVLSARDQLAQIESGTASALVEVYRALGGGWMPPR